MESKKIEAVYALIRKKSLNHDPLESWEQQYLVDYNTASHEVGGKSEPIRIAVGYIVGDLKKKLE
ncbi:MAG: hypothetical protein WC069_05590 [Candidatus Shapirobacteria bacterium]